MAAIFSVRVPRDERSAGLIPLRDINPTERFPVVTLGLIVLNIAIFAYEWRLGPAAGELFVASFGLTPAQLFAPVPTAGNAVPAAMTLITSMFLHGGLLHLAGNMLYLWIFGNNVEDGMGKIRFLTFYAVCGVFAAYAHAFMNRYSLVPLIGASGAVSGVLGAYLLLFPRARVVTLIFFGFYVRTVRMPAMIVLGFWFALQFLNALFDSGHGGGIAWYAHVAGFAGGLALVGLFKRKGVPFWGGRRTRYL
jgi:membrane associated rhomboid family serine protease